MANNVALYLFILNVLADCFVLDGSLANRNVSANRYHVKVGIPKAFELMEYEKTAIVKNSEGNSLRVIGGTEVGEPQVYPYQAGIIITLTSGWTSVCGGSLISIKRVVTAAHCWYDGQSQAKVFKVVLGSLLLFSGGTRIDTTDVTVHPSWNTNDIIYDVAMVRITPISLSAVIQTIPLPTMSDVSLNLDGMTATVSGFGKTSDAQNNIPTTTSLHHSTLTVISNAECQKSFGLPIHGSHLCTSGQGKKGTCDGDSGGPLTVVRNHQRVLVGIVSFGLADGCEQGYPSVFSRTTAFLNWIEANL